MADKSVAIISRQDLLDLDTPASAYITNVQHLSSYNWIKSPSITPTIAVPGCPDRWSPPHASFRLKKDSGHVYISQNAARHPDSPLEPLFRALYISYPSFDIANFDVVTDRNNIRKLLGVVNNRWCSKREDFTIHVEVKKNTAIFCRSETKTEEYIGPNEFRGYGHSFERRCTRLALAGSTGHHRIISYSFGDLRFIVRHETDGYVEVGGGQSCPPTTKVQAPTLDDLSNVLESLELSPGSSSPAKTSANSKLVIRQEGQTVPLASTLEIKTRVAHRPLAFEDVVSQLWISQTPKLVRAYHTKGVFEIPKVDDVAADIKAWENQNQKDLKVLASLIGKIRNVVKEFGGRAVLEYDANKDSLSFRRLRGGQMLPKDVYARWDKESSGSEANTDQNSIKVAGGAVTDESPAAAGVGPQ
jgi:hypothetical protein